MANLSYSNTPLIADLYDTPEAALVASIGLGCNGYRTYNINGQNKYVPCATYLAYEQALRFVRKQGVSNAISGRGNIADKAVGLQFANNNNEIAGDPFFTLGNFSISTSVSQKPVVGKTANISPETRVYTAESINALNPRNTPTQTNLVDAINAKIENNLTVTILFDKKKLENYVLYSPLKETVKNTIVEISQKYPASLKLNVIGLLSPTVTDYSYNSNKDTSEFKINLNNIENPFGIEYTVTGTTITDVENITPLRNFSKRYNDFVVYFNETEYKILNATLPSNQTDTDNGIYLVVQGNPFGAIVNSNQTVNTTFWLKPSLEKFDEFQNNLSDMGKFLMDYDYDLKVYKSVIRYTKVTDSGVRLNTEEHFVFPQFDEVNIDIFSSFFDSYLTKLNQISDDFDATKTNLISRFLTTDSLKEFDTDDRKINLMFGLIGKNFDNIRKYVDGITFMTNLSYDKIENIPDLLVKNFGNMLGFETYNVEDENTIIESIFNIKDLNIEPGLTPAEIDIELWRRIFINAYYLWKSKGTRKSIEFILNLVGLPDSIFEIDEKIYIARNPVNFTDKSFEIYRGAYSDETLLTLLPFDKDGYPTVPHDVRYQESGFTTTNNGKNFGPYDFGKQYIQAFEKRGDVNMFTVDRYTDNVKSWAYSTEEVLRLSEDSVGYTEYYEPHSKLVINSKELEVYLASDKIFDLSVYRYYNRNNVEINSDLTFDFVPSINGGDLTFNQFLQKSLDNYIKPDNRKTIKTYPTLTKIYYDYLKAVSSPMTNTKNLEFLSYFDSSWVKLVQQFTPATTILNAGKKIQNSKFMDNKFIYKHGLNNNVNWLGTDGSEFQDLAKKTVNQGLTNPFNPIGTNRLPIAGESSTFTFEGLKGKKYSGYDPTINEYFGFYYGIEDACASEVQIYKWEKNVNYGDDAIYGGNINTGSGDRKGVYIIYDNNLYRLNTNQMYVSAYTINTDPTPYTDDFIYLDGGYDTETITLPNGPGEYLVEFTIYGQDAIKIYDGLVSGTELDSINGLSGSTVTYSNTLIFTTNQISIWNMLNGPNNISVTNLSIGLVNNVPNSFDVYDLIPLNTDASTVTFKDSTLTPISIAERNYYVEAISFGHAYLVSDIDFICPIPKPHTCYFNFSGNSISMTGATSYYDESGKYLTIEQSKYYGFSKYTGTTEPDNAVYGSTSNWVIPYQKQNTWTNGVIYYAGDVVTKSAVNYLVTGATVTGYTVGGTPTGTTLTDIVPGLYQHYTGRTTTDPYMHINSAYIKKNLINPLFDRVSFNLTKSLYLYQVYSGATEQETYKVLDNLLNDELYISDSNTLSFDGFYSLDDDKIGPFYTPDDEPIGIQTLVDSLELIPDKNNYIDFESLNTNFDIVNQNIGLSNGYFLIKQNKYFKFDIDLFFESELATQQSVLIKLIDQFNSIIYEQLFNFSGSDQSDFRVVNFTHEGVFFVDTKVYLAIEPITQECKLSRYETIDIDYTNETTYDSLDDPRFRVYFNGGRGLIDNHYFEDALSIEPIGHNDDHTVDSFLFKTSDAFDKYEFVHKLNINQSYDETNNFGLLYGAYFEKYKNTSEIGDVSVYEKKYNNDYVNFELKVRSKELTNTPQYYNDDVQIFYSFAGVEKEFTITSTDNYLGNTPQTVENTNLTKNIFIGKIPKIRQVTLNKQNYPFLKSYKNDVEITSSTSIDFIGYDEGLADYNQLDFNSNLADSLISKKRHKLISGSVYGYWKKENDVYETELYRDILDVVPYFSSSINNYVINDIVKIKLSNYRKVVETISGTTVSTVDVDRLYVCVEDITTDHLCKITGTTATFEIHPIYRPNGPRTCFIPIERYDLKRFTPIGYDKLVNNQVVKPNVAPYRYSEPIILDGSPLQKLNLGDIVKFYVSGTGTTAVYNLCEYVYNRPLTWDPTNSYSPSQIVYYPGSNFATDSKYSFWFNIDDGPTAPGVTPTSGTGDWHELPITGANENSPFWIKDIYTAGGLLVLSINPSAFRVKNLLPTKPSSNGYEYALPLTGSTGIVIADMFYKTLPGDTNTIPENSDIIDYFRVTGATLNYTGTTGSLMTFSNTQDTNLIQNNYTITNVTSLVKRVGQVFWMWLNQAFHPQPLFHTLVKTTEDNGILNFATGTTYNGNSIYQSKKYTVSRNVLYRTKTGVGSFTNATEPHLSTNWVERDFMLVNKFTFKKDRCKVKIYEGTIESINDITKSGLYFFDTNLKLKTGFTEQTFSGNTTNQKLLNGINKLFDAKNTNLRSVKEYGFTGFRRIGNDLIMDYFYEKDDNGLPLTGEFIGGLTITNPCGHVAKTVFGALFEADLTKLDELKPRIMGDQPLPENAELITGFKPEVRLIINQNGASNVTVLVENNTAGTSLFNRVLTKNKYFDENIVVNYGESITISVKTDTTRNLTRYVSGFMDNYTLFDTNDNGINNGYFTSTKENVGRIVTRTIKLKDISEGRVVKIDFDGAILISVDTVSPNDFIKIP